MRIANLNILKPVLNSLSGILTKRRKIQMVMLLFLTIGYSLVETVGISAIMPLITLSANPALVASGWYKIAFDLFNFEKPESFIIALGFILICFYIFRAFYSVFLTYFINRFSLGMNKYLSVNVFKVCLSVPYKTHVQKNTGELMHSVSNETSDVSVIILNLLQALSEIFTICMVYAVIMLLNWRMTMVVTAALLLIVLILFSIVANVNKSLSEKRQVAGIRISRAIKESLGNYKYVKLKGNEQEILQSYERIFEIRSRSDVINNLLGVMPKNILESIGFSLLIAAVIYVIWAYGDASWVIPIITMYALALYRILPSIHRLLLNLNNIAYRQKTLESVAQMLRQPTDTEGYEPINFTRSIRLEDLSFQYLSGKEVLDKVSLEIKKGEKIAIVGESGGGKSTLIDIIIGIHRPVSGTVYIDDAALTLDNIRSWRKKIGYIPQNIYLFDGTVAENVSFGSEPNNEKIIAALRKANIWNFLAEKDGLNTMVGEGGIQLSGGQTQRIGIARALYDDPEVLILDEATSALDGETEQKIMDELYQVSEEKTLIIIAHRLSTVERCDRKIVIEKGKIVS